MGEVRGRKCGISLWLVCGGFLKWWYPTTMGFPTKNDHFGGVLGVPPFKETPMWGLSNPSTIAWDLTNGPLRKLL